MLHDYVVQAIIKLKFLPVGTILPAGNFYAVRKWDLCYTKGRNQKEEEHHERTILEMLCV